METKNMSEKGLITTDLKVPVVFSSSVKISEIQAKKGEQKIPSCEIKAYSGGVIVGASGYFGGERIVIDLNGISWREGQIPLLYDHEDKWVVGHSATTRVLNNALYVNGLISGTGEKAAEVIENHKNGYEWQASVGIDVKKYRYVDAEQVEEVNGRLIEGPFVLVVESLLNEVSFCAIGADSDTQVQIAAKKERNKTMNPEKKDENTIVETKEEIKVEAKKEEEVVVEEKKDEEIKVEAKKEEVVVEAKKDEDITIKAVRSEQTRISGIMNICADKAMQKRAIEEGWTVEATKAAMFDLANTQNTTQVQGGNTMEVNINTKGNDTALPVALEAAMIMQTGAIKAKKLTDHYDSKVLDAADKYRNVTLREMISVCAKHEGKGIEVGSNASVYASTGFSTISLPNLLNNVLRKALLDGFEMATPTSTMLAEELTASDFKQHTGIQLGGVGLMESVKNGQALKHGTFGEETFSYTLDTVGKIIGLTREMIINDDLGGFTRIARNLGISAYQTRENAFWSMVLGNTGDFFDAGNGNYFEGATSALSITSIATAEAMLMAQTGIDGLPIAVEGQYLVVPAQLGATARGIYAGTNLITGATSATIPETNVFAGMYEPVVTPYLSNAAVHANYSDKAWYLWSGRVRPFGIAYLNGQSTPTVEDADPGAEYLGKAWRAYFDFAVCQVEKRGAVMSKGEA